MNNFGFGEWLRKELENKDMSQADLSRAVRVTTAQMSRIISGQRSASNETLLAIAYALHLKPEFIFEKVGILPPKPDNLSDEQQEVIHLVMQIDDQKTLRMISAMLDQALDDQSKEKSARH